MEVGEVVETSYPSINRRPEKGPTVEAGCQRSIPKYRVHVHLDRELTDSKL
jgi:hypothetical protein